MTQQVAGWAQLCNKYYYSVYILALSHPLRPDHCWFLKSPCVVYFTAFYDGNKGKEKDINCISYCLICFHAV